MPALVAARYNPDLKAKYQSLIASTKPAAAQMADDKSKVGARDRAKVAADQDYEVSYFAQANGISEDQARELIKRHGSDRGKLEQAAREVRKA